MSWTLGSSSSGTGVPCGKTHHGAGAEKLFVCTSLYMAVCREMWKSEWRMRYLKKIKKSQREENKAACDRMCCDCVVNVGEARQVASRALRRGNIKRLSYRLIVHLPARWRGLAKGGDASLHSWVFVGVLCNQKADTKRLHCMMLFSLHNIGNVM